MRADLEPLFTAATPIDEQDWGSVRQVAAQNALFARLEYLFPGDFDEASAFDTFALKATTEEMLAEARRIVEQREEEERNWLRLIQRRCDEHQRRNAVSKRR